MKLSSNFLAKPLCHSPIVLLRGFSILMIGLFSGMGHVQATENESALYINDKGNIGIGMTEPKSPLSVAGGLAVGSSYSKMNAAPTNGLLVEGNVGIGTTEPPNPLSVAGGMAVGKAYAKTNVAPDNGLLVEGSVGIGTAEPKSPLSVAGGLAVGNAYAKTNVAPDNGLLVEGNVGIGTATPGDKLDVAGNLRVLTGFNPIRFTSLWSGFPDQTTNQAEISNDTNVYKTLMIVGNKSADKSTRQVGIWDRLEVHGRLKANSDVEIDGSLFVRGRLTYLWTPDNQWKHIQNRSGDWAGSYNTDGPSDLRFKTEVKPIASALDKINRLRGVSYNWNNDAMRYFTRDIETNFSAGPGATKEENQKLWQSERDKRYKELATAQVGVIAQEVEAVLPEAVATDKAGYKSVHYHYLIPLLIEALKEQDKTVTAQAKLLADQQKEIERLTAAHQASLQQLSGLAAMKAQLARLEAVTQQFEATQAGNDAASASFRVKGELAATGKIQ